MTNPFNYNVPTRPADFLGRQAIVRSIAMKLAQHNGNSYVVIGGRRMGKSSLLEALKFDVLASLDTPNKQDLALLPISVTLQGMTQLRTPEDVLGGIVHRIREVTAGKAFRRLRLVAGPLDLGLSEYSQKSSVQASVSDLEETVCEIADAGEVTFGQTTRLVILLDEADIATYIADVGRLFGNLRWLVTESDAKDRVRLIIAGSERLNAVGRTGSPLLNAMDKCFLEPFNVESTRELIARTDGLPPVCAAEVAHLGGGHPFILQYLLYRLFETGFVSATTEQVQEAARHFVVNRHADMDGWWQSVGVGGQKVYASLSQGADWMTDLEVLEATRDPDAREWLTELCCHGVVVHDGTHTRYRISGAIFHDWAAPQFQSPRSTKRSGGHLEITVEERRDFRDAFASAFPNVQMLMELLYFGLGTPLNHITGADALPDIIRDLLVWTEAQGNLPELIVAARNANPGNPKLRRFAEQYLQDQPSQTQEQFEKTILPSVPFANSDQWRTDMSLRELAVCRVEFPEGQGRGTGFLLGPNVLMTNYHVILALLADQTMRQKAVVRFDYKIVGAGLTPLPGQVYRLASDWLIASSPKADLDFALLQIEGAPGEDPIGQQKEAYPRGFLIPKHYDFTMGEPILIFGHPQLDSQTNNTEPMKYTLGSLTALPDIHKRITYNTNTEPGSSGSPCFNSRWELVAIHAQAGNRGIPFSAIIDDLSQKKLVSLLGKQN